MQTWILYVKYLINSRRKSD